MPINMSHHRVDLIFQSLGDVLTPGTTGRAARWHGYDLAGRLVQ